MLLQVRVKGIIEALVANTNVDIMPVPLIVFIDNLTQEGNYVPNSFLSKYQLNRIDTDNYGAFISIDDNQLKMIAGTYIFAKVLVMNIFMSVKNNREAGEGRINSYIEDNFQLVGSILYYLFY